MKILLFDRAIIFLDITTKQSTMTDATTFEQAKLAILRSFNLEGATECESGPETEQWKNHPDYPKEYLFWAEFKNGEGGKDGKFIFYDLKVKDTSSEQLVYTINQMKFTKQYFDEIIVSIDSSKFGNIKRVNRCEETRSFRTRMEQLLLSNQ